MNPEDLYTLTYAPNGSLTSRKILDMADEALMNEAYFVGEPHIQAAKNIDLTKGEKQ